MYELRLWEPCGQMFEPQNNLAALEAADRLKAMAKQWDRIRTHAVDMKRLATEDEQ